MCSDPDKALCLSQLGFRGAAAYSRDRRLASSKPLLDQAREGSASIAPLARCRRRYADARNHVVPMRLGNDVAQDARATIQPDAGEHMRAADKPHLTD